MNDFIISADWHINAWKDAGEHEDGINRRLLDGLSAIRQMVDYADKHKVRRIYQLGDVFHLKKNIAQDAYDLTWDEISKATRRGIEWVFLAGNHDREDDREHVVTILPFRDCATVLVNPELDKDARIVYVPWLYNQEKVRKFLKDVKGDWDMLLFHGEVDGAFVGPSDYQLPSVQTAETLQVGRYRQVFAGHLHKRQKVHGVSYPGSLLAKDAGELETDKGFLHVSKGKVTPVSITYPWFIVERIPEEITSDLLKSLLKSIPGNIVQLRSPRPIDSAILEKLYKAEPRSLSVRLERPKEAFPMMTAAAEGESVNLDALLEQWVDYKRVPESDRERYLAYAREKLRA